MNKIDDFLSCAYDAQIKHCLCEDGLDESTIPDEFRPFIMDYIINDSKTIGESLNEYLGMVV